MLRFLRPSLSIALLGILPACDFVERTPTLLQIVSPAPDQTFRETDDVNSSVEGTQIEVLVEGEGEGHEIVLARLLGGAPQTLTTGPLVDGSARLVVTLVAGPNVLQAQDRVTGRTSVQLTTYLESPCRKVELVEPKPPLGATELVLGPRDDRDGAPCGDGYAVRIIAATGLLDGSAVTLLAGDLPLMTGVTRGGVIDFDPVPFGEALSTLGRTFQLALRFNDSQCPDQSLSVPVRIDCEGPMPCQIEPLGVDDVVNAEADSAPDVPGLQLPVSVLSAEDARGQAVELVINDVTNSPLKAVVDPLAERPVAVFEQVSLPEGDVRLDAICYDSVDNQTKSARRTVFVDSLGCPVTITMPAEASVIAIGEGQTEATVEVTATFTGGDCAKAYALATQGDGCGELFSSPPEPLAVGQTSFSRTFTLTGEGSTMLCMGIADMNENREFDFVRVIVAPPPDAGVP